MKRIHVKMMPYLFGIVLTAGMTSCGGNGNANTDADSTAAGTDTSLGADHTSNSMSGTVDSTRSKISDMFSSGSPDSNFVVKAGTQNADEIKLLQAGIANGTSAELKSHAKMMLADHQKMGMEVKAYAAKKKYSTLDSSESKAADELSDLNKNTKGKEWDKAWADKLVDGHEKTIKLFEDGQSTVKDPTLSGMIGKKLPTLHSHLTMVQGLQNSLK